MDRNGQVRRGVSRLPNYLTLLRIFLIPLLVALLMHEGRTASVFATLTFFVACWSDFWDGYVARRYGVITPIGKFLDPLADKLMVMAALVMLAAMVREPRVPAWMVVVIIGRDLAVTGLRAIAVEEGVVLAAEELGKYKMIFQMFALHGLLLHYDFLGVDWYWAGMYFLWVALVVGLWSGVDYSVKFLRHALAGS
jgi:CDP-diacylglycerol--glycerol-3-phosphate 3-phosphatidyltransferase